MEIGENVPRVKSTQKGQLLFEMERMDYHEMVEKVLEA